MFFKEKMSSHQTPAGDDRVSVQLKNLINLSQSAGVLKLHHASIRSLQSGGYVSRFKGRGMEFDETRLYQPGDDIRSIDWRVTARTGKTHTKLFREEREKPVFVSVDFRATMRFATRGVFKSVQAARLAALIAWAAQQQGDKIGGQLFEDNRCVDIKPQSGRHGVLRLFHELIKPVKNELSEFTLEKALTRLNHHTRPGSLIYIISDFRGLNQNAENHLRRLTRHCDVVLVFVYDALERDLPRQGRYRLTDEINEVVIDTSDQQRVANYHQKFVDHSRHLENLAKKWAMTFIQCSTTDDPVQSLR
jgi:uncharacterized protein (DUF58 family)